MDHHIGLAFSVEQISYAIFDSPDMVLSAVGTASYPFKYEEDHFLQQENRISLTSLLKNIFAEEKVTPKGLSFSIESNLAILKRITYPENLEETGKTDHIAWHLKESLNMPFKEYIFIRSENMTKRDGIIEELVISIHKKLVSFFREIARNLEVPLNILTVHHLSTELALHSALSDQTERLMVMFKIASSRIETSFFLNGRYFNSHYERIPPAKSLADFQTNLVNKIKEEIGYIENLAILPDQEEMLVDRVLLYGPDLDDPLLSLIQKNMSIPVDRFNPLQNIVVSKNLQPILTEEVASKYVECIGVSLNQ